MKKPIRNITMLVIGLLLTGLPAVATSTNWDASVSGPYTYILGGGSVDAPSNATVGWYLYAYTSPGHNAAARVSVHMAGPGIFLDVSLGANGSNSGSQGIPQAGIVNCYLEAWQSESYTGAAGCGVTVGW